MRVNHQHETNNLASNSGLFGCALSAQNCAPISPEKNAKLHWNAASAVTEADQKENRIFAKKKSTGRIDGVVASAMAIGASEEDVTDDGDVDGFFDDPIIVGI